MVNHQINCDVKLAVIRLHERGLLHLQDILECCDLLEQTFYRILKLWWEIRDVVIHRAPNLRRQPHLLDCDNIDYVICLVHARPEHFLDELLSLVKHNWFISVHFTTIFHKLECANMSCKKLWYIAKKCNEDLCADFITRMAKYDPEQIGFIDETSKDEQTVYQHYRQSSKGHRASSNQVFVHGHRTTVEALLTLDGIISVTMVEGSMTQVAFLDWLENSVVCSHIMFLPYP